MCCVVRFDCVSSYVACTLFHCLSDPVLDASHVSSLVTLAVQGCSDADDEAVRHNVSALCACCNSSSGGTSSSIASSVLAPHAHPLLLRLQLLLSASAVRSHSHQPAFTFGSRSTVQVRSHDLTIVCLRLLCPLVCIPPCPPPTPPSSSSPCLHLICGVFMGCV